jgi:hypothetical protein
VDILRCFKIGFDKVFNKVPYELVGYTDKLATCAKTLLKLSLL